MVSIYIGGEWGEPWAMYQLTLQTIKVVVAINDDEGKGGRRRSGT